MFRHKKLQTASRNCQPSHEVFHSQFILKNKVPQKKSRNMVGEGKIFTGHNPPACILQRGQNLSPSQVVYNGDRRLFS